ncbi:MAG: hypothetical protein OXO49_05530 [Gammaproteobacteria bacterium]|nr:hypothetical protein [Gammaproteobacteria bacterium]MDE0252443.1 hypothetical protein [Gammaproteobacteria bacterium]MDE0402448.1 hypothetical protein [Gammaproteobacteria bacterium]
MRLVVSVLVLSSFTLANMVQAHSVVKRTTSINDLRDSSDEVFDVLDVNNNDRITFDEIGFNLENSSEEEAETLRRRAMYVHEEFKKSIDRFDIADTNKDAVLDREERENEDKSFLIHLRKLGLVELDTDRKGSIDRQEFDAYLTTLIQIDDDGNGYLTREELTNLGVSEEIRAALGRELLHVIRVRWDSKQRSGDKEELFDTGGIYGAFDIENQQGGRDEEVRSSSSSDQSWQGYNINELRNSSNEAFDLMDVNNDGRINFDEINFDLENFSEEETPRVLRLHAQLVQNKFIEKRDAKIDRFDIADTNKDAVLDREERENEDKSVRTYVLQISLNELDTDKNGSIDRQEFGPHLTILNDLDDDENGYVNQEEFANLGTSEEIRAVLGRELWIEFRVRWVAGQIIEEKEALRQLQQTVQRLWRDERRSGVVKAIQQRQRDEETKKRREKINNEN